MLREMTTAPSPCARRRRGQGRAQGQPSTLLDDSRCRVPGLTVWAGSSFVALRQRGTSRPRIAVRKPTSLWAQHPSLPSSRRQRADLHLVLQQVRPKTRGETSWCVSQRPARGTAMCRWPKVWGTDHRVGEIAPSASSIPSSHRVSTPQGSTALRLCLPRFGTAAKAAALAPNLAAHRLLHDVVFGARAFGVHRHAMP